MTDHYDRAHSHAETAHDLAPTDPDIQVRLAAVHALLALADATRDEGGKKRKKQSKRRGRKTARALGSWLGFATR